MSYTDPGAYSDKSLTPDWLIAVVAGLNRQPLRSSSLERQAHKVFRDRGLGIGVESSVPNHENMIKILFMQ